MKYLKLIMLVAICLLAIPTIAKPEVLSALNSEDFHLAQEQPSGFADNPFVKDIRETDLATLKLLAIVHHSSNAAALINHQIVRVNDFLGTAKVVAIDPKQVILSNDSGIYKLNFEGQGK